MGQVVSFSNIMSCIIMLWQAKRPARKAKDMDEDGYQLSRFYPLLQVYLQ